MRVIVCGGRDYTDYKAVFAALNYYDSTFGPLTIIQGGAAGADFLAKQWAEHKGRPCVQFDADWKKDGRAAGPKRNQRMIDKGGAAFVIAFPGGRGTDDMINRAVSAGLKVARP